ncbi:CLUMA_CG009581, isoform A [Clunio marinus]|uniref:CLUMA_CG009581, isoform A n=1 Tax=Clunio marinus TaxID=568069 RepID=A0A1J1I7B5_9DIPT|nr:CLUMA_CG009581, isoform A [Clunio marinus]
MFAEEVFSQSKAKKKSKKRKLFRENCICRGIIKEIEFYSCAQHALIQMTLNISFLFWLNKHPGVFNLNFCDVIN